MKVDAQGINAHSLPYSYAPVKVKPTIPVSFGHFRSEAGTGLGHESGAQEENANERAEVAEQGKSGTSFQCIRVARDGEPPDE
jgi:hypothetical protein